jgi:hypothetical protein
MTQARREELRFSTPALVVARQCHAHYDRQHRPLPIDRVPLEERTGTLSIILALGWLKIDGVGSEGIYPQGAIVQYGQACEVILEVFPRGRSAAEYVRWQRDLLMDTVRLSNSRTPLFVSAQASMHTRNVFRGENSLEHMRVLQPDKLAPYLECALPLLGTNASDVQPTLKYINQLLVQGKKRIQC